MNEARSLGRISFKIQALRFQPLILSVYFSLNISTSQSRRLLAKTFGATSEGGLVTP
jgi:hypothetical protein